MFNVKSQTAIALCYNDKSVLENFHCTTLFYILRNKNYNIISEELEEYIRDSE